MLAAQMAPKVFGLNICLQHGNVTTILHNQSSKPAYSLVALYGDWNIFSQVNGSHF
jgi:hypothetical protein